MRSCWFLRFVHFYSDLMENKMKVTLIRNYVCAPEGHTVLKFEAGMIVDGNIASMALMDGAAVEVQSMASFETKIEKPQETKVEAKKKPKKG